MIACPKCGNGSSTVNETRKVPAGIRRRRFCVKCQTRFSTVEQVVPERSSFLDPMVFVDRREIQACIDALAKVLP